jgi:hypothetical protein
MRNAEGMQISKKEAIRNTQEENKIHVHSNTSKKSNYKKKWNTVHFNFLALLQTSFISLQMAVEIAAFWEVPQPCS